MTYQPQDFARCAGNPCFTYCQKCGHNIKNSPVNPEATHQWYMGSWIIDDERCPSFVDTKEPT